MSYKLIIFDKRLWLRDCRSIPCKDLERIKSRIHALEREPWSEEVQVKQLHHFDTVDFRLRIGSYRVLFNRHEDKKIIFLLRVLHRSKLY